MSNPDRHSPSCKRGRIPTGGSPRSAVGSADYSRQYVHQWLRILVAAEYVNNLGHGLHESEELPEEATRNSNTSVGLEWA